MEGVQLYVSDFQRPITERLQSDFFGDPALAAVTCLRTGKVPSTSPIPPADQPLMAAFCALFPRIARVR